MGFRLPPPLMAAVTCLKQITQKYERARPGCSTGSRFHRRGGTATEGDSLMRMQ